MIIKSGLIISLFFIAGCGYPNPAADFHNPGGMWIPNQIADHSDTLKSLGVENPEVFVDPLDDPLGAIVWLGGCSASFVSPNGLIITNHHCAQSSLQSNSSPECNLLDTGFLAKTLQDEIPAEIGKKVWVTRDMQDVTDLILDGLNTIENPLMRYKELENRIKILTAENDDPANGIRGMVKSCYEGQQYFLIRQFEIKDIRLVYAPDSGIGWFGGDIDNWKWPRHTGDFTFFRAYVGPDEKPAEYSKDNIPFHPGHYLKIADSPLEEGDFVLVAGYPGSTQRWKTAEELAFAYQVQMPKEISILTEVVELYRGLARQSQDLEIKVTPSIRGVMNHLQLLESTYNNFRQYDLLAKKNQAQNSLLRWIQRDSIRKRQWGNPFNEINKINEVWQKNWYQEYLFDCIIRYVRMIDAAHTIVKMAEERQKPDEQRDPDYQQRNWDRISQSLQRTQISYDPQIDKVVLRFYLSKLLELPSDAHKPVFDLFGLDISDISSIEEKLNFLYSDRLKIDDTDYRIQLFENAHLDELWQNDDPIIQLALQLRSMTRRLEDQDKIRSGQMILARKPYVDAVKTFNRRPVAADANGSLRITYGTVRGYRPTAFSPVYTPFTTLTGVLQKNTGTPPFKSPQVLLDAANLNRQESPFYCRHLKDIPVNFLSSLDITGGNSGSATLDKKGRLVGLVFDGNSEALASNWIFMPDITRAIHVDIRYILWIMQNVDHADNLLKEMGVNTQ